MKKYGFTLAEVLLTLGIVGVIAALTIPVVITDISNKVSASKLSAAVSAIENGLTTMLVEEYADDLSQTPLMQELSKNNSNENTLKSELSNYFKTNNIIFNGYGHNENVSNIQGTQAVNFENLLGSQPNKMTIILKNGAFVTFPKMDTKTYDNDAILRSGGSTNISVGKLLINVNGAESPNRLGRDVFVFVIGGDGNIYPYGGIQASLLTSSNLNDPSDSNIYSSSSNDNFACRSGKLGIGSGCTARLIENNYKFDY